MRRTRTLSQEALAHLVGISQESLSKAERGVMALRPDVQARLAAILGVPPEDIFPAREEVA